MSKVEAKLHAIADQIKALMLHPATGEEYDAGYIAARTDAFAIVQEVIDNLPPEPMPEAGLSIEEQKAQGKRCGCHGADDYCPCQNVPDAKTLKARATTETKGGDQ